MSTQLSPSFPSLKRRNKQTATTGGFAPRSKHHSMTRVPTSPTIR
nr:hypothetical protein pPsy0462b_00098 [Pseudomonas syringae]